MKTLQLTYYEKRTTSAYLTYKYFHPVAEWEAAKPENVIFDQFVYTENQEIRKVKGRVKIVKRISLNGIFKKIACYRKVRWDASGHCFIGTHNVRSRHLDIPFSREQESV